jgi:sulfur-carrier protein
MAIKVILFGQLIDLTGKNTLELEDVRDTHALQQKIHTEFPALAGTTYRIAVDKKMITEKTDIPDNTTIALLPPFSGG